jgi:GTP diphosphokinase / guanosine-3',5'-bis(diphosphate) 3'-diphosphatase
MQFEVQIRTEEMHRMAEEGIAAHWKYKDGSPVSARDEQRLAWLRQVVEWQQEVSDPGEFLSTFKVDLYPEEVYTFTPKGKVVVLPRDATPLDFAYTIHTEVGHTCVGARVNGRIVPLRHKLKNGDVVEIMTQANHAPSRDWLAFVKSSRARHKIKHWLNVHQRERAIEIGKKLIEKEARKYRVSLKEVKDAEYERVATEYGLGGGASDLYAGIGYGKYSARQVLARLAPATADATPQGEGEESGGLTGVIRRVFGGSSDEAIKVVGHDELLIYRARCCNPIRGENIVGYITRGKGVAVHSTSCPNVVNLLYEPERKIKVEWSKKGVVTAGPGTKPAKLGTYPVKLSVVTDDRTGMLKNLTAVISDDNTNIRHMDVRTDEDQATIEVVVDIEDMKHLERIITGIKKVQGVRDVARVKKL